MPVQIEVPSVGESVSQVTVYQWMKKDGDYVEKDEPVVELETDKVNQELNAPEAGILRIKAEEGAELEIGGILGMIEPGEKPGGEEKKEEREEEETNKEEPEKEEKKPAEIDEKKTGETEEEEERSRATPVARKVAAEYGVDLKSVDGHGVGGRVTKEDVLAFVGKQDDKKIEKIEPEQQQQREPAKEPRREEAGQGREVTRRKMSQLRRRIATRLVEAQQTAAILTTFNEADMSAVMEARNKYKEKFKEKHGIGLGFMSFFIKAAVVALKEFPNVNAYLDGDELIEHHYCDVGVAVGTERGLVVPVIRNAEKLSFAGVEEAIRDFATRAQNGKLALEELSGGTFTISNGGVYGSMLSTPILNPPQSGILGMHNIQKRPMAVGDEIVIRPMMFLALSYDHRIVDGKEAVSFLVRIKECIEAPERMLLDI